MSSKFLIVVRFGKINHYRIAAAWFHSVLVRLLNFCALLIGMTEQEKNLARLAAWDRYQSTRTEVLACKSRLRDFREEMGGLMNKLAGDLCALTDLDALAIPSQTAFSLAVREFKAAEAKYTDAVQEARRWNWPIPEKDEPAHLCR